MNTSNDATHLLDFIVDKAHAGIFVVDENMNIHLWNNFMAVHSGKTPQQVLGKNLFTCFPELPKKWLERKIRNVFILKNYSFSSWKQRPFLFEFQHNRPVTGGVEAMRQDCTLLPVKDESGAVRYVCFTLFDVTDASVYQQMLHEANQKLQETSDRDGLTGLYNRRYSEDFLSREYERAFRYNHPLGVIITDIDFFKRINDEHGHLAGDEVLRQVSSRLAGGLRKPDVVGRYGGEEFLIVLPETDASGAYQVAERLRRSICDQVIQFENKSLKVSISLGVSQLSRACSGYENLILRADRALYVSKASGRNQVTQYSENWEKAS